MKEEMSPQISQILKRMIRKNQEKLKANNFINLDKIDDLFEKIQAANAHLKNR